MDTPDQVNLDQALELAIGAARAAEPVLMKSFRDPSLVVEAKQDGSLVSRVDRDAEAAVRAFLAPSPLGHFDVLGEEAGTAGSGTRLRWVVDPLDGTISYTKGLPLFGTLVALEDQEKRETLVGVTYLPALGQMITAVRGSGCELQGKPARVSQEGDPSTALLVMGDPGYFERAGCRLQYEEMIRSFEYVRGYTDCFGDAMLLGGSVGLLFDTCYKPWDLAPLSLQVPEAGGVMLTRESGDPGSRDILAGSPALVEQFASRLGFA